MAYFFASAFPSLIEPLRPQAGYLLESFPWICSSLRHSEPICKHVQTWEYSQILCKSLRQVINSQEVLFYNFRQVNLKVVLLALILCMGYSLNLYISHRLHQPKYKETCWCSQLPKVPNQMCLPAWLAQIQRDLRGSTWHRLRSFSCLFLLKWECW